MVFTKTRFKSGFAFSGAARMAAIVLAESRTKRVRTRTVAMDQKDQRSEVRVVSTMYPMNTQTNARLVSVNLKQKISRTWH